MSECTLSVVLPNYNHARFLPFALEALLAQTRQADEIIIIDDASTDDSAAVIGNFLPRHPNLRFVQNSENLGVVRNVNRGLEMVSGRYLFYASADDAVHPLLFERGLALLSAHPQASLFSASSDIISADGRSQGVFATPVPRSTPGFVAPETARRMLMQDDAWFNGTSTIWRRQHLSDIGGFPEELGSFADGFVARQLALTHGSCFSPEVLGSWRRMEGGYAWELTSIDRTQKLIELVRRRMSQSNAMFPPGYADRWARRHLFGARRFRLACARNDARSSGLVPWISAWAKEVLLSAWYFMTLRPLDTVSVLRRRLRWALNWESVAR